MRNLDAFFRRTRSALLSLTPILLAAAAALLPGCNVKDAPDEFILNFRNPEVTENLDSLHIYGITQSGSDTLVILSWRRGDPFPKEVEYPPGLGKDFNLLVQGFKGDVLVRQTKSVVAGGLAGRPTFDRLLLAPDLADNPIELPLRYGDTAVLAPIWKQRPGWQGKEFVSQGTYAWRKGNRILARDTLLNLPALAWEDSGTYVFQCENSAGRDSMSFLVSMRHRIPKIGPISDRATLADQALTFKAEVIHSDALVYRWIHGSVLVSEDSVLTIPKVGESHAGAYRLEVRNATNMTEVAVSNVFRIHLVRRLSKWDAIQWDGDVWW